jgi:hypothetical protein
MDVCVGIDGDMVARGDERLEFFAHRARPNVTLPTWRR